MSARSRRAQQRNNNNINLLESLDCVQAPSLIVPFELSLRWKRNASCSVETTAQMNTFVLLLSKLVFQEEDAEHKRTKTNTGPTIGNHQVSCDFY